MCGTFKLQAGNNFGDRMGVAIRDVDGGPDRIRVATGVVCDGTANPTVALQDGDFKVREDL